MPRPVLILLLLVAAAAQPARAADDKAAIRATIADYIEGYYLGDAARMERSLHPHFLKHTVSGVQAEVSIADKSGSRSPKQEGSDSCGRSEGRYYDLRYRWRCCVCETGRQPLDELRDALEAGWTVEDTFGRQAKPRMIPKRPNQAMERTADRSEAQLMVMSYMLSGRERVPGRRSSCTR